MIQFGKVITIFGVVLGLVGPAIWGLGRLGFGGLLGDVEYRGGGGRISIPIVTFLVASLALTILVNLALWLWRWLGRS